MSGAPTQITDAAPAGSVAPTVPIDTSPTSATPAPQAAAPVPVEPTAPAPTDAAPAESKADEASPLGKKPEAAPAEPIKYEFKLPEGMKADDKQLAAFGELGNKHKLQPEVAQELLDFHASEVKRISEEAAKGVNEASLKAYNDLIGGWKKGLDSDPELSGDNRGPVQEMLGKVLDEYGSPEAREAFDLTGAGWNPAVVKMMVKMAKALTEGGATPVGGPPKGNQAKTPGSVFYPPKGN